MIPVQMTHVLTRFCRTATFLGRVCGPFVVDDMLLVPVFMSCPAPGDGVGAAGIPAEQCSCADRHDHDPWKKKRGAASEQDRAPPAPGP